MFWLIYEHDLEILSYKALVLNFKLLKQWTKKHHSILRYATNVLLCYWLTINDKRSQYSSSHDTRSDNRALESYKEDSISLVVVRENDSLTKIKGKIKNPDGFVLIACWYQIRRLFTAKLSINKRTGNEWAIFHHSLITHSQKSGVNGPYINTHICLTSFIVQIWFKSRVLITGH
jgi:hypothetical protein